MPDIDFDKQSSPVRLVGGGVENEDYTAQVTANKEISSSDILNNGGLDDTLTVGTSPVEVKVGASKKTDRKYVIMVALDNNFSFGFSSLTQNIPIFKNQMIMLPVGENTEVWVVNTESGKEIAIGEVS